MVPSAIRVMVTATRSVRPVETIAQRPSVVTRTALALFTLRRMRA